MNANYQNQDLESLFRESANTQPDLTDENFTKIVLNRLPAQTLRESQKRWLPDMVGMVVAILAIFALVEPAKLINNLLNSIPDSIIISANNLLLVAVLLVCSSVVAWWALERGE